MTAIGSTVKPAERSTCAMVQGLRRGMGRVVELDEDCAAHVRTCADCSVRAQEYTHLAHDLRALRDRPAAADPRLVESIARRIDDEVGRRLRRSWAVATVAGGLAVAGVAGVAARVLRSRSVLGTLGA